MSSPEQAPVEHVLGNPDAPVTVLEYADFECPFCGDAFAVVEEIRRRLGDRLRFVFRHFPVPAIHPNARRAAEAAEAAAAQGAFWPMHDLLYGRQPSLAEPDLVRYAAELGLEAERFGRELRERAHAERVAEDLRSGERSGVQGTPTFFVNGTRHDGPWSLRELLAAVEAAG